MKNWPIGCLLSLVLGVSAVASADPLAIVDGSGHVVNVVDLGSGRGWQLRARMLALADPKNHWTVRAHLFAWCDKTIFLHIAGCAPPGPDINLAKSLDVIAGTAGQGA